MKFAIAFPAAIPLNFTTAVLLATYLGPHHDTASWLIAVWVAWYIAIAFSEPVILRLQALHLRLYLLVRCPLRSSSSSPRLSFSPITHIETMPSDMVGRRQQTRGVGGRLRRLHDENATPMLDLMASQEEVHRLTAENARLNAAILEHENYLQRQQNVENSMRKRLTAQSCHVAEISAGLRAKIKELNSITEECRLLQAAHDELLAAHTLAEEQLRNTQEHNKFLTDTQAHLVRLWEEEVEKHKKTERTLKSFLNEEEVRRKTRCTSCGGSLDHCHHSSEKSSGAVGRLSSPVPVPAPAPAPVPAPSVAPEAPPTANPPPDLPSTSSRPVLGTSSVIVPTGPPTFIAVERQVPLPLPTLTLGQLPVTPMYAIANPGPLLHPQPLVIDPVQTTLASPEG